jgi:hypothetical protein
MKKPKPPERLYTANSLSALTKLDRRTTSKRLARVTPEKQGVNGCHKYTLEAALPSLVTPERLGETHRARKERLQADLLQVEHDLASEAAWPAALVVDVWTFTSATILSAIENAQGIPQEERDKLRRDIHSRLTSRDSPICDPSFFAAKGKK